MGSYGRNLVYTIALDPVGSPGHRLMAKMLATSLRRTYFDGDVLVFHNSPEPLFRVERQGLMEHYLDIPPLPAGKAGPEEAWNWKYRVRHLIDHRAYERIMFIDADCLVLRNIDHLFEGDWDICVKPEPGLGIGLDQFSCFLTEAERTGLPNMGINSGTLTVRAEIFQEVMAEWERIDQGPTTRKRTCSDQGSWNRMVLDCGGVPGWPGYGGSTTSFQEVSGSDPSLKEGVRERHRLPWRVKAYARGEVQFPLYLDHEWKGWQEAAVLHCLGGDTRQKLRFMMGAWMSTFMYDDNQLLLNLLET